MINMSDATFRRLVTVYLVVFFSAIYIISWATNRLVDWQSLLVFIVPTVAHAIDQITQTQLATKSIDQATRTQVAQIQRNGISDHLKEV